MELTKSELEIMNVFWKAGRPLTRGEILELSVDKKWKDNSIHILLNRLLAKNAISESGFARSGKSYGRLYEAVLPGEDYYANSLFGGDAAHIEMLFDAMLKSRVMTPDLLNRLEELLLARKAELG